MRCPDCGFVDSSVTPADAAVALRSYPRRFKAVLAAVDEDDIEHLLRRAPDGWSALDHAAHAAAAFTAVGEALRLTAIEDSPVIALAPERRVDVGAADLDRVGDDIAAAASSAADAVDRIKGKDWERVALINDHETVTALDIARHGVHEGVHHLRAAEQAVSAAR